MTTSNTQPQATAQEHKTHPIEAAIVTLLTPHANAQRLAASRLHARLEGFDDSAHASLAAVEAALLRLIASGMIEAAEQGYQLTRQGLMATRLPGDMLTGEHVAVRHDQTRLGGPKYPGRRGIVLRQNQAGRKPDGLWHVRLEPTNRAGERVELFWTKELDVLAPPARSDGVAKPEVAAKP
ncbi:hypothetical protein [Noviherbaspirillum pedocola]|uniref:Uncharacterized protein n=1 Tax=Noviherbaspirillum pedocola TaxID=2801341 RepID=A0A934SST0_9BURK|nr:hypothetical protein [Noviherbaspirillum pedocola]MBK4736111.1 hypothetical protein [Noviherbaspirillum pedocola]